MAAQLGQDTLAKDREDGTRIGAAASENQPLQQAGLPAEDLSARVLAADRRQDAMALQLEGLAAQMTAMTQAISAMAGIAVKDEKRPAMGAPNASDLQHGPDPAAPRPEHADPHRRPGDATAQDTIPAEPGFEGHLIAGDALDNSAQPSGRGAHRATALCDPEQDTGPAPPSRSTPAADAFGGPSAARDYNLNHNTTGAELNATRR